MSTRRCFKCKGLNHIALDCPYKKIISLAEWEATKEGENEEQKEVYLMEDQEENQQELLRKLMKETC